MTTTAPGSRPTRNSGRTSMSTPARSACRSRRSSPSLRGRRFSSTTGAASSRRTPRRTQTCISQTKNSRPSQRRNGGRRRSTSWRWGWRVRTCIAIRVSPVSTLPGTCRPTRYEYPGSSPSQDLSYSPSRIGYWIRGWPPSSYDRRSTTSSYVDRAARYSVHGRKSIFCNDHIVASCARAESTCSAARYLFGVHAYRYPN
mmetsp:Transcript_34037/g.84844  ORF Transcript_34037/g.84844 Transcript_34037/m.84844 type:complete len:200 (-) Transcript_34037:155-754(-)